jgi:uncharacterized RDD family membrane protein YckC
MPEKIAVSTLVGFLVVPAVTFGLLYFPIVTHLSRSLVSPYAKANVKRRFAAAGVDGLLVITLCLFYAPTGSALYFVFSAAYLLLRDAIGGQSIGKLLAGLVVISVETGRSSYVAGSVKRNLLLLLPGANVVAIFLEAHTVVRDPQGQRLGDRLAQTMVVEGLGASDFVKLFQEWLIHAGRGVGRTTGGRRAIPGRLDRAA